MGEPRHTNNVRRVDFANARSARARQGEAAEEKHLPRAMLEPRSAEPEPLKVVPLPGRRAGAQRSLTAPKQNALLVVIILLAAMLGAVLAALLLNPTL